MGVGGECFILGIGDTVLCYQLMMTSFAIMNPFNGQNGTSQAVG
jgi:hypothetical protein